MNIIVIILLALIIIPIIALLFIYYQKDERTDDGSGSTSDNNGDGGTGDNNGNGGGKTSENGGRGGGGGRGGDGRTSENGGRDGDGRTIENNRALNELVQRHNCYRKGAGLKELKVDSELERRSQEWVDYLAKNESCTMRHPGTTGNSNECIKYLDAECTNVAGDGQNIAWRESSQPIDMTSFNWAVDGWYDECQGYKDNGWHRNPGSNPETGHYTQLMWNNATRIGCGAASCGENTVLIACNYGSDISNPNGGAGNLNPPNDGGRFPEDIVPIKCNIKCN